MAAVRTLQGRVPYCRILYNQGLQTLLAVDMETLEGPGRSQDVQANGTLQDDVAILQVQD